MARRYLRVAAAQFASRTGDIDANLAQTAEWVRHAAGAGVDLLVFPELSLVGHYGADRLLDVVMTRHDHRLADLSAAAPGMHIVVGFVEEGPGAQFYNSAAVLAGGRVVYLHRKINLPAYGRLNETKHYAQGRFVDTHALSDDWRLGPLICADLWNPALTHLTFLNGATLLVAPISSGREAVGEGFDNPAGWAATMQFYAMMYGAPSVMANRVGSEGDLTFWGGSRILDPSGRVRAVAGEGPEMITADLDYAEVRQARARLPTVRDSNISLVARETDRLLARLGVPDIIRDDT